MKILKNSNKNISLAEKYDYIIKGIEEGKTFEEIAENKNVTKQFIHLNFKRICEEIISAEPRIINIYKNFDTFVDLNKIVRKNWVNFIARLAGLKNKNIAGTHLGNNYLIDRKLKYDVIIRKNNHIAVANSSYIQKYLLRNVPISIKDMAKELELNELKLAEFLEIVMSEFYYVIDGFVISSSKERFQSTIRNYCLSNEINFEGTLEEFYNKISSKYPKNIKSFKIYSFNDFEKYIQRRYSEFSSFIVRLEKDKRYELKTYAKKENLELYVHHNAKVTKVNRVTINGDKLAKAIKEAQVTKSALAKAINKHPSSVIQYCKGIGKPSLEDVKILAKELGVSVDAIIKKG